MIRFSKYSRALTHHKQAPIESKNKIQKALNSNGLLCWFILDQRITKWPLSPETCHRSDKSYSNEMILTKRHCRLWHSGNCLGYANNKHYLNCLPRTSTISIKKWNEVGPPETLVKTKLVHPSSRTSDVKRTEEQQGGYVQNRARRRRRARNGWVSDRPSSHLMLRGT